MTEEKLEAVSDELTARDVQKENAGLSEESMNSVSGGLKVEDRLRDLHRNKPDGIDTGKIEQTIKQGIEEGMKRLGEDNGVAARLQSPGEIIGTRNCATLIKEGKDKI